MRVFRTLFSILACALLVAACNSGETPEDQVRRVIDSMELAAEARDTGDLMAHVSDSYRDAAGQGAAELSRYVRGYFIANQSIHLLTRIDSVEFPSADEARATVSVGMASREAAAATAWNLAADIHEFDLALLRENGDWKVVYAKWSRD